MGAVGRIVAKLFGADPKPELNEDLLRLDHFIETGTPARDALTPRAGLGSPDASMRARVHQPVGKSQPKVNSLARLFRRFGRSRAG